MEIAHTPNLVSVMQVSCTDVGIATQKRILFHDAQ